jgi:hypothetical protein
MRKCWMYFLCVAVCVGQTRIDLRSQTRVPDFSTMAGTRPIQVGASLPPLCTTGELYFLTTAPTGENLFGCATQNGWSVLGAGMGGCTVDADSNLACPGDFVSGNGTVAGELRLYEREANGYDSVGWIAPDQALATYRLRLPASGPANGESLYFGSTVDGMAAGRWVKPAAMHSTYHAAAQSNGAGGWQPGAGWTVRPDGTGPQINGTVAGPIDAGFLVFPAASTRTAGLHTILPENWHGGAVAVKVMWGTPAAGEGQTMSLDISTACIGDGESMTAPEFGAPVRMTAAVPYAADAALKRVATKATNVPLTGCSAGDTLYLHFSRVAGADTLTGTLHLWGVETAVVGTLE